MAEHGIYVPKKEVDDFGGTDARRKVVVSLLGAPWELVADPRCVPVPAPVAD